MPSPSSRGPCSPPRCAARCCRSRCAARRGTPRASRPGFPCPRRAGRARRVSCRSENEVSGQKTLVFKNCGPKTSRLDKGVHGLLLLHGSREVLQRGGGFQRVEVAGQDLVPDVAKFCRCAVVFGLGPKERSEDACQERPPLCP